MATENRSRPPPENGDEGGNRPRTRPTTTQAAASPRFAKPSNTSAPPTLAGISADLRTIHTQLTLVMSLVVVSVGALENQSADNDIDVAMVLRRSVAPALYNQAERIAALAARCERAAP
jgi:hypothetical protein